MFSLLKPPRRTTKPKFRWTTDKVLSNLAYLTMVLPGAIWLILFAYLPMPGIIMAFKDYRLQRPPADHWIQNRFIYSLIESPWVGLENFRYLVLPTNLNNTIMYVRNTVLYNLLFIVVGLIASIALAVVIYELTNRFWAKLYHSIFFLPFFISWVVVAYVVFALANHEGIINTALAAFNLPPLEIYKQKIWWPFIFLFGNLWKYTGYSSILYLAIITGIDRQLYEAAAIDGANKWQQFWNVTLPHLVPTIVILQILAVGRIFGSDFDMFYTLPAGSVFVRDVTTTIDVYVFNMLRSTAPLGYPAAVAFVQSVVGFVLIIVTNYIVRKTRPEMALF